MTKPNDSDTSRRPRASVAVLADPGLPADLARGLEDELPDHLARHVSPEKHWEVRTVVGEIPLDSDGRLPLVAMARRMRQEEEFDYVVCLTELPRRAEGHTVAADLSTGQRAALVSVPAIGWLRLRKRIRNTLIRTVAALSPDDGSGADSGEDSPARHPVDALSPVREVVSHEGEIDRHLILTGLRGQWRLLLGLVRNNRPWRLVPSLSKAIAAATATSAFGIFYSSIWSMADALSPVRLLLISLFALTALTVWLIVHNGLWERPLERENPRDGLMYNLATVLTLLTGGLCMYLVLFATTLTAAAAVISADYLQQQLQHPAGPSDYLTLTWLSASMGTVAGALGSSLETEHAVRQATYSKREQQRRAHREEEEREAEEAESQQ